jgi:purine-cytosine permease-like protein
MVKFFQKLPVWAYIIFFAAAVAAFLIYGYFLKHNIHDKIK